MRTRIEPTETYSGSAITNGFRFINQAKHTARRIENTCFLLVDLSLHRLQIILVTIATHRGRHVETNDVHEILA